MRFRFYLDLRVDDAQQLQEAAEKRAVEEGLELDAWRQQRVSAADDLIMLLDPNSLAGCSIDQSGAEEQDGYDADG